MSNSYGEMELLWQKGKLCKVRFIDTGYEREALIDNVRSGKVRDITVKRLPDTEYPNKTVTSNTCGDFIILEKCGKSCVVQFVSTGYTTTVNYDNAIAGKVRDPYVKSQHGVGYLGEYAKTPYHKQAKQLWNNVLKRCYSDKDPRGYKHKGTTVDARWLCFANFLEDLPQLENFSLWLLGFKDGYTKYNLDKDIKIPGNNVYSREACMFISEFENKSAGGINRHR
jgi:hypothetical protein